MSIGSISYSFFIPFSVFNRVYFYIDLSILLVNHSLKIYVVKVSAKSKGICEA